MALCSDRQRVDFHSLMPLISAKLEQEGKVKIPAQGNSMFPLFRHGRDQVILEMCSPCNVKKYDMILYCRPNGQYVLHRVVGVKKDGYILRGDGQLWNEYPVRPEWIIARVGAFRRGARSYTCACCGYRVYAVVWTDTVWVRRGLAKLKRGMYKLKSLLASGSGK